jgi:hypothetical protein
MGDSCRWNLIVLIMPPAICCAAGGLNEFIIFPGTVNGRFFTPINRSLPLIKR